MAAKNEAKIKFIAETSEFNEQIKKANQSMSELRSELKLSEAQFKGNEQSVEALSDKKRILQEQLDASAEKVEALRQKLQKAKEIYGENSTEVSKLKTQLNNAQRQYVETENAIEGVNRELNDQEQETEETTRATKLLDDALDKSNDGFTVMKGVISDLVTDGLHLLIDGLKETAKYVLNTGMDFEAAMSQVEAVSGASAQEMVQLEDKAKQMGATTKFSATEAAEAFNYMAMAGWKTGDMLDGIEGIMNLAAAANADLGTASDIVTDALTAMGYAAGDAGKLADVMAAASSNANTNVEMMGYTFKYAAPIVGSLGYSMEDLAIATGIMANAGIKGEMAGTQLRAGMLRLTKPTKDMQTAMDKYGISITNSDGSMKSLMDVMKMYRSKLGGLTEAEQANAAATIFGTEAASGWLSIINASDEDFEKLTEAVYDSEGAAQKMAETMQDNLKGDLEELGGALETVGLTAYDGFSQPMREAVQSVTETMSSYDVARLVNGISYEIGNLAQTVAAKLPSALEGIVGFLQGIIDNIDTITAGISGFVATWALLKGLGILVTVGKAAGVVGTFVNALIGGKGLTVAFGLAQTAAANFGISLGAATGGISIVIGLVVAGVTALVSHLIEAKGKANEFSDATIKSANTLTQFEWGLKNLQPTLAGTKDLTSESGKSMSDLDTIISTAEANITKTMTDELGNQKTLRAEDVANIRKYNQEIYEAKLEQLEIQRQQQEVELHQLKRKLETEKTLTQEAASQAIVDAKAAYEQSAAATEEWYESEYARMYAYYSKRGEIDSAEAQEKFAALDAQYEAEKEKNLTFYNESIQIVASKSGEWVATDKEKWAALSENADLGEKDYKATFDSINHENSRAFMNMVATAKSEGGELSSEMKQTARDMLGAFENMPDDMEESGKEALLGMISGIEGQIDGLENVSEMSVDEIIGTLKKELGLQGGGGKPATYGVGRDVSLGLSKGIGAAQDKVDTAASKVAKNTLGTFEDEFEINSPSRAMKRTGQYLVEGLAGGIESKSSWLSTKLSNFANGVKNRINNLFGVESPSRVTAETGKFLAMGLGVGIEENEDAAIKPMQGIVDKMTGIDPASEWNKLSDVGGSLNYDVSAQLGDYVSSAIDSNSPYALLASLIDAVEDLANRPINIDVDGYRLATATAGATDNVSGNRLNLRNRGLAL